MNVTPITNVNPFDPEAILSPAILEQITQNITVPGGAEHLRNCTLQHGTSVSEIPKVFKGAKAGLSSGFGGEGGIYVAIDEPALAVEYAHIKTQFEGRPGIMEGRLNPDKPFVVGRIQVVRYEHQADLLKGIWPADWSKNPTLKNLVETHFDILEVCGAEKAGLAISSNRYAVIQQKAGADAIHWNKMYDLRNKPIPIELFQKNVPSHLPPSRGTPIPPKVSIASIAATYGFTLLEAYRFGSCLRQGMEEEAERMPFVPLFGLHEARGAVRGAVRFVSDFAFQHIDPGAASVDPRAAVQAKPLAPEEKRALKEQFQKDRTQRTYRDEMLEHGVVPRDLSVESPSGKALELDRARKWRLRENAIVDFANEKLDLYQDPYEADKHAQLYFQMLGDIQLPPDFLTWTSKQQENWLKDLVSRAESCFAESGRQARGQEISNSNIDFTPDLSLLEPTLPPSAAVLDPLVLDELDLPWEIVADPVTGAEAVQTAVEVAPGDIEQTVEDLEARFSQPIPTQRRPEIPTFRELATFTHFELGEGIGGGQGLRGTLRSGAQVSISIDETGRLMTGLQVPLAEGFLTGLGTGLVYTAPIAALFFVIGQIFSKHDNKVQDHLRKDSKSAEKEAQKVNDSLQSFDYFAFLFSTGAIDKESFLREVNKIIGQIHSAAHHMGQRARYADGHNADGSEYLFNARNLRQIHLDLQKIASEAVVKREVDQQYAPQLKGMPLQSLVTELTGLANKRVLTLSEKYKQDALIGEIETRSKSGDLDALVHLDQLAGRPVAINLNPDSIAKPNHLSKSHFEEDPHSQKRKADRVKGWATKLDEAYARFEKAAQEGNIPEMESAANDIRYQIQRAKGEGDGTHIHLKDYYVGNVKHPTKPDKYCKTAWDYYEPYITKIESNVDTTLARARAAQSGTITDQSPAIFTADEITAMKVKAATDAFNDGLNKLNDPSIEGKDQIFNSVLQGALILQSYGVTDPSVLRIIELAEKHGTYTQYIDRLSGIQQNYLDYQEAIQKLSTASPEEYAALWKDVFKLTKDLVAQGVTKADLEQILENPSDAQKALDGIFSVHEQCKQHEAKIARLNDVAAGISRLQTLSKSLQDPKLKREERLKLLKEQSEEAEQCLAKGLTEEEISQILSEENDPSDVFKWVQSIPENYPHLLRVDHYENDTQHRYAAPAVRIVMHVLRDQERVHGPSFALRPVVQALGTVSTLVPNFLPAGVNWLIAKGMKENRFVTDTLFRQCGGAVRSNALVTLKDHLKDPKALLAKSFNKKVTALQGANAVVQLMARGVTVCVSERFVTPINNGALVLNATANALYYANTIKKTVKYLKVSGKFVLKAHKIGEGLISLSVAGFDIYEFLATHPSESGTSQRLLETVKFYLPNFEGNLPENEGYYATKDLIATTAGVAAGIFIGGPILSGLALFQGATFCYNRYFSKRYTDDMLSAIMMNYRYFSNNKLLERKTASMKVLLDFIGANLKIESSDSLVERKAKHCAFEHQIDDLELEKKWAELAEETVIDLPSLTFVKRNIALTDVINVVTKRYTALLNAGAEQLLPSFREFELVSTYLEEHLSKLDKKHSSFVTSVRSNLQNLKRCFLTNFCKYYVMSKIEVTWPVALSMFDKIPKEERDCIHWYFLGKVATELWKQTGFKKHPLVGIQLLSFEAALALLKEKQQMGTLDPFEEKLILICERALTYLPRQVKSPLPFSQETEKFSPVVETIMA